MSAQQSPFAVVEDVDSLLAPSYASRVAQQFFTHSAHAPVTILILEWLLSGIGYFGEPDGYILIGAALLQSAWLAHAGRWPIAWTVTGNLVGVGAYSLVESLLEGGTFIAAPQHQAYWAISLAFAMLQGVRGLVAANATAAHAVLLCENVARASIPVLLYAAFEARLDGTAIDLEHFFSDEAHVYLAIVVLLLGLLLAFADVTLQRTQLALRNLAERLHQLSSWGFGSHVVAAALKDANQVALRRQERVLLFMDIRGFTAWSESEAPEAVVRMLDAYYLMCETILQPLAPIKIKFTADEMMTVFADKAQAYMAAQLLQRAARDVLGPYRLGVGIGLHAGPVVEGLLGSANVKAYEVIGDVVNTASRLCAAAGEGELLVSLAALPGEAPSGAELRQVEAKGKRDPVTAYVLT